MIQSIILLFSGLSVYLVTSTSEYNKYAGIPGVLVQPLWIYETFVFKQWGMCILSVVFFYSWCQHIYFNLIKK
jgi:hypothetical protein